MPGQYSWYTPGVAEIDDGAATLTWLRKQAWYDERRPRRRLCPQLHHVGDAGGPAAGAVGGRRGLPTSTTLTPSATVTARSPSTTATAVASSIARPQRQRGRPGTLTELVRWAERLRGELRVGMSHSTDSWRRVVDAIAGMLLRLRRGLGHRLVVRR